MVRAFEAMGGTRTRQTDSVPDPDPHGATSHPGGFSVDEDGNIWGASVGDRNVWESLRN